MYVHLVTFTNLVVPPAADSLARAIQAPSPKDEIKAIQAWLKACFAGSRFTFDGPTMQQAVQPDMDSCGVYAVGAVAHAVFGDPLPTPTSIVDLRVAWFRELAGGLIRQKVSLHV